jgi:hypothetical protein
MSTLAVTAQDETTTETTVQTETTTSTRNRPSEGMSTGARAGIKGGLNASNFINDEITDKNGRFGFHAGVYGQLFVSEGFAVQPEVNFSTKGNRTTTEFGLIDQETKFNLNYIDIPVLAVFKLGPAVEIHFGPYWSYLVGASIDNDGDILDDFSELDRDNFTKWDYGLAGGIGFNINNLQIGARYNYGMKEIADSDAARAMLGSNAKNSVGQIYLAINLVR